MSMQNPTPDPKTAEKSYSEAELQEHVRKATSTTQAENATLKSRLAEIGKTTDSQSDALLKVETELQTLRTAGKLSEDAEGFARYEADTRAQLADERRRLDRDYRIITVAGLVKEFPTLTEAELTGFNSPNDMEIYALRNHSRAAAPDSANPPAGPAAPIDPLAPPVPQLDRGGAGNGAGGESSSLRGASKVAEGLRNISDPLGVLPK